MDNMDTFECLFAAAECQDAKTDEALRKRKSIKKVILIILKIFKK
jgi:hypothetical protein